MEADGGSALGDGAHGEAPVAPPLGSAEGRGGVNAPGQDSGSEMEEATDGSESVQDPGESESAADSDESEPIAEPGVDSPGSHPHAELGGEWVPWGGGGGAPEARPGRAVRGAQGPRLWQGFPDLTSRLWELLKADGVAEAAEALKAQGPRGMVALEEAAKARGHDGSGGGHQGVGAGGAGRRRHGRVATRALRGRPCARTGGDGRRCRRYDVSDAAAVRALPRAL